jgi:hypothetical protein
LSTAPGERAGDGGDELVAGRAPERRGVALGDHQQGQGVEGLGVGADPRAPDQVGQARGGDEGGGPRRPAPSAGLLAAAGAGGASAEGSPDHAGHRGPPGWAEGALQGGQADPVGGQEDGPERLAGVAAQHRRRRLPGRPVRRRVGRLEQPEAPPRPGPP